MGSILRFWHIGLAQFWYDENFTAWVCSRPFGAMLEAVAGDVWPPLYYILIWGVEQLTGSHAAWLLRLPSAALSVVALCAIAQLGATLNFAEWECALATWIMALAPAQLYFAQEARGYTLLQLAVLGMLLGALARRWLLLGLSFLIAIYTHNFGFIFGLPVFAIAFMRELKLPYHVRDYAFYREIGVTPELKPLELRALFLAGAVPCLLYAPWALYGLAYQLVEVKSNWWTTPTTAVTFISTFAKIFTQFGQNLTLEGLGVVLLLALLTLGAIRARRNWEAMLLAFAPFAMAMLIEWCYRSVFVVRSFLAAAPVLALIMARGASGARRDRRAAVLAPLFFFFAFSAVWAPWQTARLKGASNLSPALSQMSIRPGDIVYHQNTGSLIMLWDKLPGARHILYTAAGVKGGLSARTVGALGVEIISDPALIGWEHGYFVWAAGPSVPVEMDGRYLALLDPLRHTQIAEFHSAMIDGGVWEVFRR